MAILAPTSAMGYNRLLCRGLCWCRGHVATALPLLVAASWTWGLLPSHLRGPVCPCHGVQDPVLSCTASCVSACAPSCLSEHRSSCRVPQAGVQRTNLARALLHMQQLPAAHRVAVLHPRPEGLLLCPLLREQVCSSLHSLQKGTAGRAAQNPHPVVQGCVPCSCHEGVVGWCWGGPPSPLAGRRGQGTRGWPSCCLSVAALLQQCQGCAGCAPALSNPHQKKIWVPAPWVTAPPAWPCPCVTCVLSLPADPHQGRGDLPGRAVAQGVLCLHGLQDPPGWPAVHLPG